MVTKMACTTLTLYTPQHWEPSYCTRLRTTAHITSLAHRPPLALPSHPTVHLPSPRSPPAQRRQQQHSHSDGAVPGLQLATPYDSSHSTPSVPQMALPVVYQQQQQQQQSPVEARAPTPSSVLPSPALKQMTQDLLQLRGSPCAKMAARHAHGTAARLLLLSWSKDRLWTADQHL